jgi:hypothetical protein
MKSRRNFKKNKKTRKSLKGGFFFSNKVNQSGQCDVNKLTELKTSEEMHQNYQSCCPKGMFGTKNSSAYCKQLDLNFQAKLKGDNDALDQSTDQSPSVQVHPSDAAASAPQSPWYKFWGGKKSKRRRNHRKRKSSKRYRK